MRFHSKLKHPKIIRIIVNFMKNKKLANPTNTYREMHTKKIKTHVTDKFYYQKKKSLNK